MTVEDITKCTYLLHIHWPSYGDGHRVTRPPNQMCVVFAVPKVQGALIFSRILHILQFPHSSHAAILLPLYAVAFFCEIRRVGER